MKKGIVPIGIILAVMVIVVLLSLFYVLVSIKIELSSKLALDFFTIVSIKNTINLTEKSFQGGMDAIGSESVFHPLDTGLPDIEDSSGNPIAASESSYLKYPAPWINETITESGNYKGFPSWEMGIVKYPKYDEASFKDYIKNSITKFLVDNFATSFSQPYDISIKYNFAEPVFENSETKFGADAIMSFISSGAYIENYNTSHYNVSYPIVPEKEYEFYTIAKKIVDGFDYQKLREQTIYGTNLYDIDFNDFMLHITSHFSAPEMPTPFTAEKEKKSLETLRGEYYEESQNYLLDKYSDVIDFYSSKLNEILKESGLNVDFSYNSSIFRSKIKTFIDAVYYKKYDAYLVNYTIIANVTDPSGKEFCCNWNPLGNYSSIEKPGLRILFNDTFISVDCSNDKETYDRYAGSISREHRDDYNNTACEAGDQDTGTPTLAWHNITDYPKKGTKNLLLSLNGKTYDTFWDAASQKWMRCGYSLGDVTRVDILNLSTDYQTGDAGFDEDIVELRPYPITKTMDFIEESSEDAWNTGAYSLALGQSSYLTDTGQIICNLPGRTRDPINLDKMPGDAVGNRLGNGNWLRCTDTAADFRILSTINFDVLESNEHPPGVPDSFSPTWNNKYCCAKSVNMEQKHEYICEKGDVRSQQYCCECFYFTWQWSDPLKTNYGDAGYCVGDEYCDYNNGERAENSKDCCEKGRWIQDSFGENSKVWLARNTQGFPFNDNTCHGVCERSCEECVKSDGRSGGYCFNCESVKLGESCETCEVTNVTEKNPYCSGTSTLIECDGSQRAQQSTTTCSGLCSQQTTSYMCRPSIYGTGGEFYQTTSDPMSCKTGHPCKLVQDNSGISTPKCDDKSCLALCGGECGADKECEDICDPNGEGKLATDRECKTSDCKCSAGTVTECNEANTGAKVSCGGANYYCIRGDSLYKWIAEPSQTTTTQSS